MSLETTPLEKARAALREIQSYNLIHNDLEDYLFEMAEWGLGNREDQPLPENYGVDTTEVAA